MNNLYKEIILSKIEDYCKVKKWAYKKYGKLLTLKCPVCNNSALTARTIPHSYKMKCLNPNCNKKFSLITIVRVNEKDKSDKEKISGEEIIQYLKELLKINVITPKDEKEILYWFDIYEKNNFSLVPLHIPVGTKEDKIPIEKNWTNKEHRDINDWKRWVIVDKLNIGVRTGLVSNVTVIDLDMLTIEEANELYDKKTNKKRIQELESKLVIPEELKKMIPKTLIQRTKKGYHLFFKYNKNLPKSFFEFKGIHIDVENDAGQVVVFPSVTENYKRKFINNNKILELPKELEKFILARAKKTKKSYSEKVKEDIESSFKMPLIKEGEGRNDLLIRLAGKFRKKLSLTETEFVIKILNNTICEPPLLNKEITAMMSSLKNYNLFDEEDLANEILVYLKNTKGALRLELQKAMGEDSKKIAKVLNYLVKENKIIKTGSYYFVLDKPDWESALIDVSKPINFKVPYFNHIIKFNYGDNIVLGAKTGVGKTTIAMNIVKQLIDQGIKPKYISRESGSRFIEIALQLGIKEGDFEYISYCSDPTQIEFDKNDVIIIDWLLPKDFARTDRIFDKLAQQLSKNQAFMFTFMQLRKNGEFFAKDQVEQFPALSAKYFYDNPEDNEEYGHWEIYKVRAGRRKKFVRTIPCYFDWNTKILSVIENIENKKKEEKKDEMDD